MAMQRLLLCRARSHAHAPSMQLMLSLSEPQGGAHADKPHAAPPCGWRDEHPLGLLPVGAATPLDAFPAATTTTTAATATTAATTASIPQDAHQHHNQLRHHYQQLPLSRPSLSMHSACLSAASYSSPPLLLQPFGVRHASFWPFGGKKTADAGSQGGDPSLQLGSDSIANQAPPFSGPPADLVGSSGTSSISEESFSEGGSSFDAVAAIHDACDAIEQVSIDAAMQESWFVSSYFIQGIQTVHETSGMPWWASIAAINILMRFITFPLMVVSQKTTANMMKFNHGIQHAKHLQEEISKATTQEESNRLYMAFRAEYNKQVSKSGDPMKMAFILPGIMLTNGFIFISIFNGVSKLMESKAPSLTVGGMLWFNDLTVPDPYYGLPIICCLTTLAMVEFGISAETGPTTPEQMQQNATMKWFMRAMSLMFIPAGSMVSAGTCMLWVSNSAVGIVQGMVMRNSSVRQSLGLPTMQELREMGAKMTQKPAPTSDAAAANPLFPPPEGFTTPYTFSEPADGSSSEIKGPPPPGHPGSGPKL